MRKYMVSCVEKLYYASKEIEANSKEQAEQKYFELWDAGMVEVNDSEVVQVNVEQMK